MSNPTLILVPGSWHQPACYDKIVKILHGTYRLKCVGVTLPSASDNPAATLKNDIDAVRDAMKKEFRKGRDVVVVAHSYGGLVANSAIKGFAKPQKLQSQEIVMADEDEESKSNMPFLFPRSSSKSSHTTTTGHVVGLVLMASGFSLEGLAFMDPFLGHPPPYWRVNRSTGYCEFTGDTRELFYHDLPEEEGEYWVSQLTNQSVKSLFEGGEHVTEGWRDVPSWYLGTTEDHGMPVAAQRMTVGMARAMGAHVEHRELPTSHSPFLSMPKETAGFILEAVEAFTGREVAAAASKGALSKRNSGALFPAFRFWEPLTWLRYGLPLGFGHVLGKGVLAYGWLRSMWRSK
ncbi:hypothetical protein PG984_015137 [Apiospora sp. TS-2023a]